MTLEEIKKTGDKKAILKYRTQCAKNSVKEYREQMRDATPEERESVDAYIKSISKPTGIDFDSLSDSQTIHHLTDEAYSELCLLAAKGRETLQPSGDAVSRQAVLDYIHRILNQGTGKKKSFEFIQKYVEKLPPVNSQELSRDMEEIEEVINCDADAETKCKMISYILTAKPHYFEEQEPKTGHWIEGKYRDDDIRYNDSSYKCDKCGRIVDFKENYCPNCGARMIEPQKK